MSEAHTRDIRTMTDAELAAEDAELARKWEQLRADCESGGAPGEWIVERSDEIAAEQARRFRPAPTPEGE